MGAWLAGTTKGPPLPPLTKGGAMRGAGILDDKTIWRPVDRYARKFELGKLAPHDLRRKWAKLCRRAGGDLK